MATSMYDFTREYYRVPVSLTAADIPIDPTTLTAEFAIVISGARPVGGDWLPGTWETVGGEHRAIILVGDASADFEITAGSTYDVYFRITDTPERPARLVGQILAK